MLSLTLLILITLSELISAHISALFKIIPKKDFVYTNFSLAPNTNVTQMSKLTCLRKCVLNEFCCYAVFKDGFCNVHTEYAKKGFIISTIDSIYEKKLIFDHCKNSPCKNSATCINELNYYECICTESYKGKTCTELISLFDCSGNNYWSIKTNSCQPCPSGFTKYSAYPFTCYNFSSNSMNYEQAKAYCLEKNSSIVWPKSLAEQRVLTNFINSYIWVNSTISYIGEPFLWPDGSRIRKFHSGEPNNGKQGNYILNDNLLIYRNFEFYDAATNWGVIYVACQIID